MKLRQCSFLLVRALQKTSIELDHQKSNEFYAIFFYYKKKVMVFMQISMRSAKNISYTEQQFFDSGILAISKFKKLDVSRHFLDRT